ncbi:unnamed protein product, partial [Ectocarpus sp. 4 AP-2014]
VGTSCPGSGPPWGQQRLTLLRVIDIRRSFVIVPLDHNHNQMQLSPYCTARTWSKRFRDRIVVHPDSALSPHGEQHALRDLNVTSRAPPPGLRRHLKFCNHMFRPLRFRFAVSLLLRLHVFTP